MTYDEILINDCLIFKNVKIVHNDHGILVSCASMNRLLMFIAYRKLDSIDYNSDKW